MEMNASYIIYTLERHRSVAEITETIAAFREKYNREPELLVVHEHTVIPKDLSLEIERTPMAVFEQTFYLGCRNWNPRRPDLLMPAIGDIPDPEVLSREAAVTEPVPAPPVPIVISPVPVLAVPATSTPAAKPGRPGPVRMPFPAIFRQRIDRIDDADL